uniref:Somatomedin-B and thrombospondin type-1 domain-containing protein n=1 Tax=Ceratitis capitata TaxID=7213 RepID=W8AKA6_CERCA
MCTSQHSVVSSIFITTTALTATTYTEKMHSRRFHTSTAFLLELLIVVILLLQSQFASAGSCREAQLCCNGRDSSCVVQKTPVNAIIEDLNDKPCYCDHACLKLGDCCADFKEHCGVVDCQVSDWTPWSECDKSCGTGIIFRQRKIIRAPQNGGKHCPTLIQKRSCEGFRCHSERGKRIIHETAYLLPSSLARQHNTNKSKESLWHEHDSKRIGIHDYCIEFEVINAARDCLKIPPYDFLAEGDRVTVHCNVRKTHNQPRTRGHLTNTTTKNQLIDFKLESSTFESDDVEKSPITHASATNHNNKMNIAMATHCRGEGAPGRTTRWRSLAVTSCQGKWLRLTLGAGKKCTQAQFKFV